ncbi:MAG: amino acid transport protein [Candidatus Gracilibacteria bacterium]|nr:amino acid transport protein [Candidatus Gracilibacteria bacterium]MDD2908686.1 amino acid transport protein [Candidatus Gracilibacteria bacterium]
MNPTILVIGVISGAFGTGYFIYGKNQQMAMPMISGIALCIYPYFIDNIFALIGVGIFLIILPFLVKF